MTERRYLTDIKRKCSALGVWRDEFERTQKRLAKIYVRIDEVERQFEESGGAAVVLYANNKGKENERRNPYLAELDILYDQALTYEKELGLTAAALRRLNEEALRPKKRSALDELGKALSM